MKKMIILGTILMAGGLAATAAAGPVEQGKALFNSPTLAGSTNAASCNGCHPNGKGLEKSTLTGADLNSAIRTCVTGALSGTKRLDDNSAEMKNLRAYLLDLRK